VPEALAPIRCECDDLYLAAAQVDTQANH
jgi:hypothetical protein